MAAWPDWSLRIPEEIARFVVPREVLRLGLRPARAGDLHDDPAALVEEIYNSLRSRKLGYTSTVLGESGTQTVQTPEQVLQHKTPNCVDMTVLFAGICLACDLVPLVMVVTKADNTRHALVCVAPKATTRSRTSFDLGPVGGSGHVQRVGPEECAALVAVAASEGWITVETTGACHSRQWSGGAGEPASLSLTEARRVGEDVLVGARQIDLVDVHRLHESGLVPHQPRPDPPSRWYLVAAGVVAVVALVSAAVWRPWEDRTASSSPMSGAVNIAVAELSSEGVEGDAALRLSRQVADALERELAGRPGVQVRGPDGLRVVTDATAADRATELNADVLVHGTLAPLRGSSRTLVASIVFHTARHPGLSSFPLAFDERIDVTVSAEAIDAGLAQTEQGIRAVVFTLDGLAALVADQYDVAFGRLEEASALATDIAALATALQAWSLLARASIEQDPALVDEAGILAQRALEGAPRSELALLTDLSVEYLRIIPPGSPDLRLSCPAPDEEIPTPSREPVEGLTERVRELRDGGTPDVATPTPSWEVQLSSLLGRLQVAAELVNFAERRAFDAGPAMTTFEQIIADIGAMEAPTTLRIWASDAHRWLGRLSQADPATPAAVSAGHFLDAAATATPIWRARDHAAAGLAHRCRPGGDPVQAACEFSRAALQPSIPDQDRARYRAAAVETGVECPQEELVG